MPQPYFRGKKFMWYLKGHFHGNLTSLCEFENPINCLLSPTWLHFQQPLKQLYLSFALAIFKRAKLAFKLKFYLS